MCHETSPTYHGVGGQGAGGSRRCGDGEMRRWEDGKMRRWGDGAPSLHVGIYLIPSCTLRSGSQEWMGISGAGCAIPSL
jgi:hypothetical protein